MQWQGGRHVIREQCITLTLSNNDHPSIPESAYTLLRVQPDTVYHVVRKDNFADSLVDQQVDMKHLELC